MINDSPIFISLLYRSGSTLLSLILDQSKEINSTSDTIHFMRHSINQYKPIEKNYKNLIEDTCSRIKEKWNFNLSSESVINRLYNHTTISQSAIYDSLVRTFLNLNDEETWCDRTAVAWEQIPVFLNLFPKGKAIHIYRDPRAVLLSFKKYTFLKGNAYLDSIFASSAMLNFLKQPEIAKDHRILLIKYEDLVSNPESEIKNICSFLEIDFENSMLDVASFKDKFGNRFDGNSSHFKPRKSIDSKSVNLWEDGLSKEEIYFSEKILSKELSAYEYSLKNVKLKESELLNFKEICNDSYIRKRIDYWEQNNTGLQAYPDTPKAYE